MGAGGLGRGEGCVLAVTLSSWGPAARGLTTAPGSFLH